MSRAQGEHEHGQAAGDQEAEPEAQAADPRLRMLLVRRVRMRREFNQLTGGECSTDGRLDAHKLKAWQAARDLDPDGKLGPKTLAAAKSGKKPKPAEAPAPEGGEAHAAKPKHHPELAADSKGPEAEVEVDDQPTGDEQAHKEPPGKENDPVLALAHEINKKGLTPELQEKLEQMGPRAIDRVIHYLNEHGSAGVEKVVAVAKHLKEEKEEHKEKIPHGDGKIIDEKKKEHYGAQGLRGDMVKDTKAPPQKEFTHASVAGVKGSGTTLTGEEAHASQAEHEQHVKEEEKDKKKSRGKIGDAAAHLHSTLGKTETKEKKASVVDKKEEFGDGEHWGGDVHERALDARAKAGGEVEASWDKGITVEGNASASATLVSGGAKIHTPPLKFNIAGEQFMASFNFFVDAGILAEAKGKIAVNLHPSEVGVEAGISGFAGAKVSASANGTLDWIKKSPESYVGQLANSGAWKHVLDGIIPASASKLIPANAVAPMLARIAPTLIGGEGDALILAATAKGEGSAGIGAAADIAASFKGGVIHCHGKAGVTFGLGVGGEIDAELGIRDGMALLAVLAMKGANGFANSLKPGMQVAEFLMKHKHEILHAIVEFCNEASHDKARGPWSRQVLAAMGYGVNALDAAEP